VQGAGLDATRVTRPHGDPAQEIYASARSKGLSGQAALILATGWALKLAAGEGRKDGLLEPPPLQKITKNDIPISA
jgi:hypothetical protein